MCFGSDFPQKYFLPKYLLNLLQMFNGKEKKKRVYHITVIRDLLQTSQNQKTLLLQQIKTRRLLLQQN